MRYIFSEILRFLIAFFTTCIKYLWNMIVEDVQIFQNISDMRLLFVKKKMYARQKWTQPMMYILPCTFKLDLINWKPRYLLSFCRTLVWSDDCVTKIIPIGAWLCNVECRTVIWKMSRQSIVLLHIGKEFCTTFCFNYTLGLWDGSL